MTRLRGRALHGQRLVMDAPLGSWGTQTFSAGLTTEALIAPWVIKGAMDGDAFAAYIRNVLAPELAPRTVVICDNLATHCNKAATQALREAGCWFRYLPPYSPDLNPIEMAFAKLKAHLRRIGARTFTEVFEAIGEVCNMFDPQECWNYFQAAGHVASEWLDALAEEYPYLDPHLDGAFFARPSLTRGPFFRISPQIPGRSALPVPVRRGDRPPSARRVHGGVTVFGPVKEARHVREPFRPSWRRL